MDFNLDRYKEVQYAYEALGFSSGTSLKHNGIAGIEKIIYIKETNKDLQVELFNSLTEDEIIGAWFILHRGFDVSARLIAGSLSGQCKASAFLGFSGIVSVCTYLDVPDLEDLIRHLK